MKGICARILALHFLLVCIYTNLACFTLAERAAATQKIQKNIQALHARTSPLSPPESQDLLCEINDALSLGVRFAPVWELLGRALLDGARDKKDEQATRLLITLCEGQGGVKSLMCKKPDGSFVEASPQRFIMARSVCDEADELFKSLRVSPVIQEKLSLFEKHLRRLFKK